MVYSIYLYLRYKLTIHVGKYNIHGVFGNVLICQYCIFNWLQIHLNSGFFCFFSQDESVDVRLATVNSSGKAQCPLVAGVAILQMEKLNIFWGVP